MFTTLLSTRWYNLFCGVATRRWLSLFRAALRSAGSSFIVGTPVNARHRRRAGVAPSSSQPRRRMSFGPRWRRDASFRCGEKYIEKEIESSLSPSAFAAWSGVKRRDRGMIYRRGVRAGKRRTVYGHDLWNPSGQNFSAASTTARNIVFCFANVEN